MPSHPEARIPDWYPLLRAARYLKVAPWELMEQPMAWQQWANIAEAAEIEAQNSQRGQG